MPADSQPASGEGARCNFLEGSLYRLKRHGRRVPAAFFGQITVRAVEVAVGRSLKNHHLDGTEPGNKGLVIYHCYEAFRQGTLSAEEVHPEKTSTGRRPHGLGPLTPYPLATHRWSPGGGCRCADMISTSCFERLVGLKLALCESSARLLQTGCHGIGLCHCLPFSTFVPEEPSPPMKSLQKKREVATSKDDLAARIFPAADFVLVRRETGRFDRNGDE